MLLRSISPSTVIMELLVLSNCLCEDGSIVEEKLMQREMNLLDGHHAIAVAPEKANLLGLACLTYAFVSRGTMKLVSGRLINPGVANSNFNHVMRSLLPSILYPFEYRELRLVTPLSFPYVPR